MRIFDSHFHIIDSRFPLVANNGYLPETYTIADYLEAVKPLDIRGGTVVSGSFQAFDQNYLLDALHQLGPAYTGVTQLPATVADEEILELDQAGVRGIRFNLKRGGSESVRHLQAMACRVHALAGWHVELYIDSTQLQELFDSLIGLPRLSIDHLGLSTAGLPTLLKLVEHGARVKASGFGRVDFDVAVAMQQLNAVNPEALMFGTDLPSTRAARPFQFSDLQLIQDHFDDTACERILYRNAIDWYQPCQT